MNYARSRPVALSKTWMLCGALWALFSIGICSVAAADPTGNARFVVKELALPGANGLVSLDYFIFDPASHRLWVPASNTGSVDIIDGNTNQVDRKSTRLNSSHTVISYAVFCLKKKKKHTNIIKAMWPNTHDNAYSH